MKHLIIYFYTLSILPTFAATFIVSDPRDVNEPGTFRWAYNQIANDVDVYPDTIKFDFDNLTNTIVLNSSLPALNDIYADVVIDGLNKRNNQPVILTYSGTLSTRLFNVGTNTCAAFVRFVFRNLIFVDINATTNGYLFYLGTNSFPRPLFHLILENIVVKNCRNTVSASSGVVQGGMIYLREGGFVKVMNSAFINNQQFVSNSTSTSTSPVATIFASSGTKSLALSRATFINCTFFGNYSNGGVGCIGTNHHLTLINNTFANNRGTVTGGVYINTDVEYNVLNCLFQNNLVLNVNQYGKSVDFATSSGAKSKGYFNGTIWTSGVCDAPTAVFPNIKVVNDNSTFKSYNNGIPELNSTNNTLPLKSGSLAVNSGVSVFTKFSPDYVVDFGFPLSIPDVDQLGNDRSGGYYSVGSLQYESITTTNNVNKVVVFQILSFRDFVRINVAEAGFISLYNSVGVCLLKNYVESELIIPRYFQPGTYIVKFVNTKQSDKQKIIVQ